MIVRVLKIGGNELSDPGFLLLLAQTVARMRDETGEQFVIVHGGGRAIAEMQSRLELDTVKVDGLRVTDARSLFVAEMVLSGHSNKLIVKALLAAGVDALGLSGVDGAILRCQKKLHPKADLGYVGEIVAVRTELLLKLMKMGVTAVLSPISLGHDGQTYNVNADEAASAVALALQADQLDFISNVPGVLVETAVSSSDQDYRPGLAVAPKLTPQHTQELIEQNIITGGMIPKVSAALEAIGQGVPRVRIVNIAGFGADGGTIFE